MIDFVSTSESIDDQSRKCAQFISAVIAQALRDLMIKPSFIEKTKRCNIQTDPLQSLNFFYGEESPFKQYAFMVGIDPESFIHNLETRSFGKADEDGQFRKIPFITYRNSRIMKVRINWYKQRGKKCETLTTA